MDTEIKEICIMLKDSIDKIVEKKILEVLDGLGVEFSDYATVKEIISYTADSSGTITAVTEASVQISDFSSPITLINKSGEILEVGDKVKIYGSRTNIANRYIGIKI